MSTKNSIKAIIISKAKHRSNGCYHGAAVESLSSIIKVFYVNLLFIPCSCMTVEKFQKCDSVLWFSRENKSKSTKWKLEGVYYTKKIDCGWRREEKLLKLVFLYHFEENGMLTFQVKTYEKKYTIQSIVLMRKWREKNQEA